MKRKIFAILLVLALVCSLSITAFAANDGSITINNAVAKETYTIYKLFDLESFSGDAYTYTINNNSDWFDFFSGEGAGAAYVELKAYGTEKYTVTAKNGFTDDTAAALATAALAYAKANSISHNGTKTVPDNASSVTFDGLSLGYYLVDTSLGSLCGLDTTDKDVTINEKNPTPDVTKEVKEDSTGLWGDINTADIKQTVEYKSILTDIANVSNLVFHDKMTHLTFTGVSAIKLNNETDVASTNFTVTPATDNKSFTIKFEDAYLATLKKSDILVIYYSATLDTDAVIGGSTIEDTGNPNECYITFGNEQESKHDKVKTFTYEINVYKFTKTGENETPLQGVEFILYKGTGVNIQYAQIENNKITGWTATREGNNGATTLKTDANGMIYIQGLDVDTYYLEETKALPGYNMLTAPITITIAEGGSFSSNTHSITVGQQTTEYFVTKVENNTGTVLPETGGIGTTIFYVLGSILVLGAGVLLVTKKRMKSE